MNWGVPSLKPVRHCTHVLGLMGLSTVALTLSKYKFNSSYFFKSVYINKRSHFACSVK